MAHNIKSIRSQFKEHGVFYSDPKLAEYLKGFMPEDITEVYDPTCGDGALLSVFPDSVEKYGQELDPNQVEIAKQRLANSNIVSGDTLVNPIFINKRFKAIVANPPFSVKWNPPVNKNENPIFADAPCLPPPGKADYAFLLHILYLLADDGVAAVVNSPGICYRGQREGRIREWLIKNNFIDKVIKMGGGYFVDTRIEPVVLILRKNRSSNSILMRDDTLNLERDVPISEISESGYNLSVNFYVRPPEPDRPPVNPLILETNARSLALKRLRAELDFSLMVANFEGWSIDSFLDDIQSLINEFRELQHNRPVFF